VQKIFKQSPKRSTVLQCCQYAANIFLYCHPWPLFLSVHTYFMNTMGPALCLGFWCPLPTNLPVGLAGCSSLYDCQYLHYTASNDELEMIWKETVMA
jgi:hypothetical protein